MRASFPPVGARRRVLIGLILIAGVVVAFDPASARVNESSMMRSSQDLPNVQILVEAQAAALATPVWNSIPYIAAATGTTRFELVASVPAGLRLKISDPATGDIKAEANQPGQLLRISAWLAEGVEYLVTWQVDGPTQYTVAAESVNSDGLVIKRGELDSTRKSAPSYLETNFASEVSGVVSFEASWDGPSALSMSIHDPETGLDLVKGVNVVGGSIELEAELQASRDYKLRIWSNSGTERFSIAVQNHKRPVASPPNAPNILIINIDDARLDSMSVLPAVQKWFGEGGTTFSHGFVSTPSCCPSRATLMSGQYVHNHGVVGQEIPALDQSHTIQRYLYEAGYLTGHSGKFLHYFDLDQRGPYWDRWHYFEGGYYDVVANRDGVVVEQEEYSTTLTFDRAIEFAEDFEQFADVKPWFLHITPIAPHRPSQPEPRFADAPVPARPSTPSFFEADKSDKPQFVQEPIQYGPAAANNERDRMLRTLMSLDEQVDRLMIKLEQLGELENTFAIFTSDNGVMLGEHGLDEKFVPYREAIEVPFFIRWPGRVAAGAIRNEIVGNVDIAPTALAAAGVGTSHQMDGINILADQPRKYRFTEYFVDDVNGPRWPAWASISDMSFVYTEYYANDGSISFREYYDLTRDPFELTNLYADGNPDNNPNDADLSGLLTNYRFCGGSSCRSQ